MKQLFHRTIPLFFIAVLFCTHPGYVCSAEPEYSRATLSPQLTLELDSFPVLFSRYESLPPEHQIYLSGIETLCEQARKNRDILIAKQCGSIMENLNSKEQRRHPLGAKPVMLEAPLYIKVGQKWPLPQAAKGLEPILNNSEGALIALSGPVYAMIENAPNTSFVRKLSDEELWNRYKLRRVINAEGQPQSMACLGVGGRAMILPLTYKINSGEQSFRVTGLELKKAGTPAYKEHNINSSFPSTVYSQYVNKPGIYLDWWHQYFRKIPVGLGGAEPDAPQREQQLQDQGVELSRLTVGSLPLIDDYAAVLRVPLSDYRRLRIFFHNNTRPNAQRFYATVQELYPDLSQDEAVAAYLMHLSTNYAHTLRGLQALHLTQGQHGSLINMDIHGRVTDLQDFWLYKNLDVEQQRNAVQSWHDNFEQILSVAEAKHPEAAASARANFSRVLREPFSSPDNSDEGIDQLSSEFISFSIPVEQAI
jgi:hypothetical protein